MNIYLVKAKQHAKTSRLVRVMAKPFMKKYYNLIDYQYSKTSDSAWVKSQKDKYKNHRCFIVGNGPSLRVSDLKKIKNEFSFAFNGISSLFDSTEWRPTFLMINDRNYISRYANIIENLDTNLVLIDRCADKFIKNKKDNVIYTNLHMDQFTINKYSTSNIAFSLNPEKRLYGGYTVTYAAMQLAIYMGFREIILLGVDHTYSREITSANKIVIRGENKDHLYDGHSASRGIFYYEGVEKAYRIAKKEAEKRNVKIINATRGGNLEIFERIDFDKLHNNE